VTDGGNRVHENTQTVPCSYRASEHVAGISQFYHCTVERQTQVFGEKLVISASYIYSYSPTKTSAGKVISHFTYTLSPFLFIFKIKYG
jgi:hypothetical protein